MLWLININPNGPERPRSPHLVVGHGSSDADGTPRRMLEPCEDVCRCREFTEFEDGGPTAHLARLSCLLKQPRAIRTGGAVHPLAAARRLSPSVTLAAPLLLRSACLC